VRISLISFSTVAMSLLLTVTCMADDSSQPCELLTESLVREVYVVPPEIPIEQDDNSSSRFPNCGYRWRVMSEAEQKDAEARNQARMMENIKAGRPPNDGIDYNIPTHKQVRLTAAAFDNPEKAQNGLEGARSFMVSRAEQRGREPKPWHPVEGVGDKAYYHGTQLSFAWGDLLIHLDVSPQERAVKVAQEIME